MGRADQLRKTLAVVELEEKLEKAKDTKKGPSRELKEDVRAARRIARADRDGLEITTDEKGRVKAVDPEEAR